MKKPDLTTEKPVRDQLHELFVQMAKTSFEQAMVNLNKVNFCDEVILRLSRGQDISEDIPEAKQLSDESVISVARQQRQQAAGAVVSAWELSQALARSFRTTVRSVDVEGETISNFDVEHVADTEAGQVRIGIKTWRRNIEVQVVGSEAAVNALSEQMTVSTLMCW